jgi:L-threonylcarbamoyladenylate synthase
VAPWSGYDERIVTDVVKPDPPGIRHAADVLRRGGLVAFPTETVYGLGAHALDRTAVRRVFDAKGRPTNDPLIVHVASVDELAPLVTTVPDVVRQLAARFWPGPLTIVLPRSAAVPDEVTAGLETVALRIPAHPVARALIEAAAIPVAAPSANLFSRPSPTRAEHVLQDLDGRIDLVVDGGATPVGVESTVLALSGDVPTILRPGTVTIEMLRELLPDVQMRDSHASGGEALPSPGLLSKHYSPRAPLTLYEGESGAIIARIVSDARQASAAGKRVGILAADEDRISDFEVIRVGPGNDLATVATRLYAAIRDLDAAGVDLILVRAFSADTGLGVVIQDRLRRAAQLIKKA